MMMASSFAGMGFGNAVGVKLILKIIWTFKFIF